MALIKEVKCERCDRRYSAIRAKCPHCGARKNKDGKNTSEGGSKLPIIIYAVVMIAVVAAVVILICSAIRNKNGELSGAKNTPPVHSADNSGVSSVDGTNPTPSQTPDDGGSGAGAVVTTPEPTPEPTEPPEMTVNSITLSITDFTLSKVGEQWTIAATISPAGSEAELKWISEDPSVATVDENGMVTAVNKGTTTVSATAGGVIAECIVRVTASAPSGSGGSQESSTGSARLSHTDVTIDSASGERFTLTVKNAPAGADVSYSVDKPEVATVDASGHVQAVAKGTANVTVTVTSDSGTETLKCIVRVK